MKKAKYFWGLFFITTGFLLLNTAINIVSIDYILILKLYPLAIILTGLSFITNYSFSKIITALWGVFIPLYVFSMVMWLVNLGYDIDYEHHRKKMASMEQIPGKTNRGDFRLSLNAADFKLTSNDEKYVELTSDNSKNFLQNYISFNNDSSFLNLNYSNKKLKLFDEKYVKINICNNIIWNFNWKINFSNSDIELRGIDFKELSLKTIASNLELFIDSSQIANQEIEINAKFSNIEIRLPKNILCNFDIESIISNVNDYTKMDYNLSFTDTLNLKIKAFASNVEIFNN